jgi:cell fate (sporulation/competence/biofilm development) regulator YmcA (YheA/YmcA/DUF963 family)
MFTDARPGTRRTTPAEIGDRVNKTYQKGAVKMKLKTRRAYGYHEATGKLFDLGDTVEAALKANMMVREYEKDLVKVNPQLKITIKIEEK